MNARSARRFTTALTIPFLWGIVTAKAAVRYEVPEQSPGIPAYARIEGGNPPRIIQDGTWAAIVFYRVPECVPQGFNLLTFYGGPQAFTCDLTVHGFEIWKNGPTLDLGPMQSELHGLGAVPVWFVKWSELQVAITDGTLTVPELWNMSSLHIGIASFYQETLHPLGVAQRGTLEIVAHGVLSNGTPFQLHAASTEGGQPLFENVKITFR